MDVFLDAERVFNALAERGIIVPQDWKNRHPETTKFTAHFSLAKSHGIISFEVRKKDNRDGMCYAKDEPHPYCVKCYDVDGKRVHLLRDVNFSNRHVYICPNCDTEHNPDEYRHA
jgi:hypothetical protein